MVQAILEGRKTQTRRVMKKQPNIDPQTGDWLFTYSDGGQEVHPIDRWIDIQVKLHCPYGQPGNRLWVKEKHFLFGRWVKDGQNKSGTQRWKFEPLKKEVLYLDNPPEDFKHSRCKTDPSAPHWYKRNSLFMPRAASRIALEITDIRCDRLNDISEGDAAAEGVEFTRPPINSAASGWKHYRSRLNNAKNAAHSFNTLWELINGEESWDANPFVWVISFKRIN